MVLSPCLIAVILSALSAAAPSQFPLQQLDQGRRKLHGRFLHITDIHPDPHFFVGGTEETGCHRNKPKKSERHAGYMGLPFGDCDSPFSLTNFTFDHLDKHWAKEIDFVIWTGDSARHDNDRKIPRTLDEIFSLNRITARRMEEVFTSRGVPVVPSIGNNDVWPHNILTPGPNKVTNEYSRIWRSFVPFSSFQVFQRGGYYSVEVIPDRIAVISTNTMYFFDSNKAVGGCEYLDKDDPGNLQFDWLEVQLQQFRQRGVQVWISGHVPPSSDNFFPGCFARYADIALRYQDTILGHLYGHMNADHFFFLDEEDSILPSSRVSTRGKKELAKDLIEAFENLPHEKKTNEDDYAVVNVSPSIIPNPYLPGFRVYSYNVTGSEGLLEVERQKRKHGHGRRGETPDVDCQKPKNRKSWNCREKKPQHCDPSSPSRTNRLWTPLGYAQYWLPDLGKAGKREEVKFKLEYLTFELDSLYPSGQEKGGFQYPIPLSELPKGMQQAGASQSRYAPYGMADLTIRSWLKFARRVGNESDHGLRERFVGHMYMGRPE